MNTSSKYLFAIILSLYAMFGISHSSHQGFWHDEIYTLTFLNGISVYDFEGSIWSDMDAVVDVDYFKKLLSDDQFFHNFPTQILHEGHPPLYFLMLKVWSYCFGHTEIALRSFSLCCGLLTIIVLFSIFLKRSKRKYSAWLVFAMLIFNPFLFYFFTEARMYALGLLLASLSFKFWLQYRETKEIKSANFLYFLLSSVGLLYTHYYGLFFLTSLAFYELLIGGVKRSIFNHSIAFFCFLPWGFAIKDQLNFHDIHWTDGVITFGESVVGFFNGIIHLLISPIASPSLYEQVIILAIMSILISLLFVRNWRFSGLMLIVIFGYGTQIFVFDQLVGHHSILVPRYYIFLIIFLYWFLFKAVDNTPRLASISSVIVYIITSSIVLIELYKLDRAPKQMFEEVAGYVDEHLDSNSRVLVFEPKGPLTIGVVYYLNNNFKVTSADEEPLTLNKSAVYIDEMLGVAYRENKYNSKQQDKLELIPFVGVFLYK